jgi:hypothetical protein
MDTNEKLTRGGALKALIVLPALAGLMPAVATATTNKAQYKYQDKPGRGGAKCAQCRAFQAPHGCSVVTGTISPNGWCTAWVKR